MLAVLKIQKTRYKQHLRDSRKNRTDKQKWIASLIKKGDAPKMQIVEACESEAMALKFEEKYVVEHIDTVMNIHMPDKNHGYVEHFKQTGIREKGNKPK